MKKLYLGYITIDEILKLLKKKYINRTPLCRHPGLECREPLFIPMGALSFWKCYLFSFQRTADILAPSLSVVLRRFLRLECFPASWRLADVTQIPKGPPSLTIAYNYILISITLALNRNQFSITSGQGWLKPMFCTSKWVKKIVSCAGVFDLAVEQPQVFKKQPKNKNKTVKCI